MNIKKLSVVLIGLFLFATIGVLYSVGQSDKNFVAPDFTLKNLEGNSFSLSETKGKVVLLDFWATWCPPCRREMPLFEELYKKYQKDGLIIVGISLDKGGEVDVRPFVEEHGITFPILIGNQDVVDSYGGIRGIPTTFAINRDGKIVNKFVGAQSKEKLEAVIKTLL